jgi:hypothetical protein
VSAVIPTFDLSKSFLCASACVDVGWVDGCVPLCEGGEKGAHDVTHPTSWASSNLLLVGISLVDITGAAARCHPHAANTNVDAAAAVALD